MAVSALLAQHLRPFEKYFKRADVVEVCINRPEEVYLETLTGWEVKQDKALTLSALKGLAHILATVTGQKFSEEIPTLATSIPGYGFRIQVVSGAMVESGISMSIRVARARRYPLDGYMSKAEAEALTAAVVGGKNILVAGGTSSGKTTFLNSLIQLIPPGLRLLTVEDSRELVVDHPNSVNLMKSKSGSDIAKVSYKDIINVCMRLRPSRILLGELDIENTVPFLRLLNSGHGGSMATIHADSPQEAFSAMVLNAQLAGLVGPVEDYARRALDVIVHLSRVNRTTYKATVDFLK
jgi:type IV secretion system protein VirB11